MGATLAMATLAIVNLCGKVLCEHSFSWRAAKLPAARAARAAARPLLLLHLIV